LGIAGYCYTYLFIDIDKIADPRAGDVLPPYPRFSARSSVQIQSLVLKMEATNQHSPGHVPDLEKEGTAGQLEHSQDTVRDAGIEKRVVRKLDLNLVPLVMAMCKFARFSSAECCR
jgi:hypothetical protein